MGLEIMTTAVFLAISVILWSVIFVSLCVYSVMEEIYYKEVEE